MLAKRTSYDSLSAEEQSVVRAEWNERLEARRSELDMAGRFALEGRGYAELDDDSRVVVRRPARDQQPKGRKRGS